ncbi:MAG: lipocalin family protein [Bacteroidales bacterium]
MKTIYKLIMFFVMMVACASCSDEQEPDMTNVKIEANNINIAGTWKLDSWNNKPLAEGIYCYITFNRKDKTFAMYQNMDSMNARNITGSFSIGKDEKDESIDIITGDYDYQMGKWNNEYIIEIYPEYMNWTVVGNASDLSVYVRCNEIPEDILAGTKAVSLTGLKGIL